MRVLLAIGDDPRESRVQWLLEATGHAVIRGAPKGEELLGFIEGVAHLQAALVSQEALGRKWPRLLRQLRKRAPHLLVILLLGPKSERAWRLAVLAGAFEAVSASAPDAAIVQTVRRALAYAVGRVVGELSTEDGTGGWTDRPAAPGLPQGIAVGARTG